ncbi:hypothetical protein Glove_278g45 [Diversispora epigaea]|uniref:Uncharacterized protein n=1 Tax=Diversispora epigaea TaxID=1348612 RepID=A0A397I9F5_9GLOM|nr:hypothetical protein Glove_278g45 [Diversispora epigaea]
MLNETQKGYKGEEPVITYRHCYQKMLTQDFGNSQISSLLRFGDSLDKVWIISIISGCEKHINKQDLRRVCFLPSREFLRYVL